MTDLLAMAQAGDEVAFGQLVAPYRRELLVHAYRLLGSTSDAEDALQDALLAAWRGLAGLRTPQALRSWLYRITTNAGLRLAERRGPRLLSWDHGPAADPLAGLPEPVAGQAWVEPIADDPQDAALRREQIELAWIAALQHLPATQRAALVLKEVLTFSAAEVADLLGTSTPAVNSAVQRARATLARMPATTSAAPDPVDQRAVQAFVDAFNAADVAGVVRLLTDDVRFTMPPIPAWFDGLPSVRTFLTERVFATPWRVRPAGSANGHPAVVGEQLWQGSWRPGALMVLHLDGGRIRWLATFVEPQLVTRWPNPPDAHR
jgi:RNA polymerase sigma-70 factor (ECF subfamily)